MAYETCPECSAQKHQLVACPQCGFKRMTVHPPLDRELLDDDEFPLSHGPTPPPVSSNFEACPTCGTRKHLLMACPSCGFSRSGNQDRSAKPRYTPKPRQENSPRYENKPRHTTNSRYDDHRRSDYLGPSTVEQERSSQNLPVVRWKRTKTTEKGNHD